jgi:RNA 2',3'-cyclic 3'-phosphodiesterase
MRLFTGIDLSEEIRERLERLLMHLRPAAHLKWSAVYNLHLTLKFIGEWPENRLPQLEDALRLLPTRPSFQADVKGVGWYPNAHHPRVFWVGVQAGEPLLTLVHDIERALGTLGIPNENRDFSAHLTLARIKDPVPLQPMRNAIAHLETQEFGTFFPDRFYLYRSQPGAAGSIYTKLAEFPFQPK